MEEPIPRAHLVQPPLSSEKVFNLMLRKATDRLGNAPDAFFVVCDHSSCDATARMEIPAEADTDNLQHLVRGQFLQGLANDGWGISLEGTYCRRHNPRLQEQEQKIKSGKLVRMAKLMPGVVDIDKRGN